MNRLPDVSILLFGREYDLAFGRGSSGAAWLLLVNRLSGAVLPATALDAPAAPAREVYVYDVDGILPALRSAGIVSPLGPARPSMGLRVCRCEVIHPGLARRLEALEAEPVRAPDRDGGLSR